MEIPDTIDTTRSEYCDKDDESLLSHSDDEDCDMEAIENAARFFSGRMQSQGKRPGARHTSLSSSSSHPSPEEKSILKHSAAAKRTSISCSSTSSNATTVRRNFHQRTSLSNNNNSSLNNATASAYPHRQPDSEESRGSSSISSQGSGSETVADNSPEGTVASVKHRDCGESSSSSSHGSSVATSVGGNIRRKSFRATESLDIMRQIEEGGDEVDSEEDCSYTTNNDASRSLAGSSLNSASVLGVGSTAEGGSAAPSLMASSTSSSTIHHQRLSGRCLPPVHRHSNTISRSLINNRRNSNTDVSRTQNVNNSSTVDDDEELEISQFTEALTRISSSNNNTLNSLNNCNNSTNFIGGSFRSRAGSGVGSGSFISRTSGSSLLGKRRSHSDMADAAAEVAKFFEDNESMGSSSNNFDDDQSAPSQQLSRRTSGTSIGTSGLDRLSLTQQPPLYDVDKEEYRPRKRLSAPKSAQIITSVGQGSNMSLGRSPSSSSILSSDDEYQNPFSSQYRFRNTSQPGTLPTIVGSNSSNLAAASAAVAAAVAAEMENRTSWREEQPKVAPSTNSNQEPFTGGNGKRRFQRRVAFCVSSLEAEAAQAQALRMELLSKDRYESRKNRMMNVENNMSGSGRPVARRSLSYTSGIKMASSIISSSMPEEQELYGECSTAQQQPTIEDIDVERMSRSMMERRVLSLPDPNAIMRLSECSNLEEETEFASAANAVASLTGSFVSRYSTRSSFAAGLTQFSEEILSDETRRASFYDSKPSHLHQPPPESVTVASPMNIDTEINEEQFPLNISSLCNRENQVYQPDSTNEQQSPLHSPPDNQFYSQLEAYISHASNNPSDINHEGHASEIGHDSGYTSGEDSFDGKNTNVFAVQAQSPNEQNVSRAIHLASARNDSYIKSILQSCNTSTRLLLDNPALEFTGDIPLHVAARHGNTLALNCLLGADKDSALIRNVSGHVPLHLAVTNGKLAAVSILCSTVPSCAAIQCEEGCLPLHDALSYGAHHNDAPQIITTVLIAFPKAIKITTDEGLLPVHLAAMSGFHAGLRTIFAYDFSTIHTRENTELMLALDFAVDGYRTELEKAGKSESNTGGTNAYNNDISDQLLSVARQQNSDEKRVASSESDFLICTEMLLMSSYYNQLCMSPRDGGNDSLPFIPLHCVVAASPLIRTWRTLLSIYGEHHCLDVDSFGQTVVHCLCSIASSSIDETDRIQMIEDMHKLCPSLSSKYDYRGFVPLHLALIQKQSSEVIKAILLCHPSAVGLEVKSYCKSWCRNFLPFQIASSVGMDVETVYSLLRNNPVVVQTGVPVN